MSENSERIRDRGGCCMCRDRNHYAYVDEINAGTEVCDCCDAVGTWTDLDEMDITPEEIQAEQDWYDQHQI